MDLTSVKNIKNLFLKHNTVPSKIMGQNFLIDKKVLNKIIEAAQLTSNDVVLEIGPGIGMLTQELAKCAKKVVAVEKDKVMIEILKETLKDYKNIEVIQGNILKTDVYLFSSENYKVVANIPYYLTSPLIRSLLESKYKPEAMVLMVQKEVTQRICSKSPKMSLLAVSVQFYAKAKIISYVSKNCFWPAPKVDSAIIKIIPSGENKDVDNNLFFKIVKAGFSQPRKQLLNNLSKTLKIDKQKTTKWLLENKINPKQRAETLSISEWKCLANSYERIANSE